MGQREGNGTGEEGQSGDKQEGSLGQRIKPVSWVYYGVQEKLQGGEGGQEGNTKKVR